MKNLKQRLITGAQLTVAAIAAIAVISASYIAINDGVKAHKEAKAYASKRVARNERVQTYRGNTKREGQEMQVFDDLPARSRRVGEAPDWVFYANKEKLGLKMGEQYKLPLGLQNGDSLTAVDPIEDN